MGLETDHKSSASSSKTVDPAMALPEEETETAPAVPSEPLAPNTTKLNSCCMTTIRQHALYNPMMVCNTCKQIVKCFNDERSFNNYVTFCHSRRRPVSTGTVDTYSAVTFQPYEVR